MPSCGIVSSIIRASRVLGCHPWTATVLFKYDSTLSLITPPTSTSGMLLLSKSGIMQQLVHKDINSTILYAECLSKYNYLCQRRRLCNHRTLLHRKNNLGDVIRGLSCYSPAGHHLRLHATHLLPVSCHDSSGQIRYRAAACLQGYR